MQRAVEDASPYGLDRVERDSHSIFVRVTWHPHSPQAVEDATFSPFYPKKIFATQNAHAQYHYVNPPRIGYRLAPICEGGGLRSKTGGENALSAHDSTLSLSHLR